MKKSNVLRAAAVAMVAALSIGAAYAAFSAITDTKSNEFSIVAGEDGTKAGEIEEPNWDPDQAEDLQPGEQVTKNPSIKNTTEYDAKCYMVVTIPTLTATLDGSENVYDAVKLGALGSNWSLKSKAVSTVAGTDSAYIYVYDGDVTPNSSTSALFENFTVQDFTKVATKLTDSIDVKGYMFQTVGYNAESALQAVKDGAAKELTGAATTWADEN